MGASRDLFIPWRVAVRVWVHADQVDDCRVSRYSTASHGYAQIGWQDGGERHVTTAHRAAWVYGSRRQIPAGMTVDHLCRNPRCVDPLHLRLMTNFENARRTHGRDWPLGECAQGHSNDHLVTLGNGRAACGICTATRHGRSLQPA